MTCTRCGAENPAGATFCVSCDEFLEWTGRPEDAPSGPGGAARTAGGTAPSGAGTVPRTAPVTPSPVTPSPVTKPRVAGTPVSTVPQTPTGDGTTAPSGGHAPAGPTRTRVAQLVCSRCGTGNDEGRRLCRHCGGWLVVPAAMPAVARPRLRDARPWWLGGERTRYQGELSRATVAFRVAAALGVVALVVGVLAVAGQHPVRRVTDLVGHLRGSGRVAGVTATSPVAQSNPGGAVDDVRAVGWSPQWNPATPDVDDPGTVCGAASATPPEPSLTLTFRGPTDVREIGIEAGLPKGDPQLAQRWRPKVVLLQWTGGTCQAVRLDPVPELQRFAVDQDRPVTGVRLAVLSAWPPSPMSAAPLDVGEVTFWHR